jgi:hypothetical protein
MIVWATGFDGFTGALLRMDIVGERPPARHLGDGRTPTSAYRSRFPQLLHRQRSHLAAGNFPPTTEMQVDFVTGLLVHLREHGQHYVAAEPAASEEWTEHVAEAATVVLIAESSWFRGANIPGKPQRYLPYAGSLVTFRKRLEAIAEDGYPGFDFEVPAAV